MGGTPPQCNDGNACTTDSCDPSVGCKNTLIDADGDGHAPDTLGTCGDDCDDGYEWAYPGADEICDSADNDCNGFIDESGGVFAFFPDCDLDGYGDMRSVRYLCSGSGPSTPPGCTGGKWVTNGGDCNDSNATVNPDHTAYEVTPIPGAPPSAAFDYNCNGVQDKRFVNGSPRCVSNGRGGCDILASQGGWSTGVAPECGQQGSWCFCSVVSLQCRVTCSTTTQTCR